MSSRARRGPVCGFLMFWFQFAIEPFALFYHDACDYVFTGGEDPMRTEHMFIILSSIRIKGEISHEWNCFFYWPFQGGSFVADRLCSSAVSYVACVLSLLVTNFTLHLMPREGRALWLWHFLTAFTNNSLLRYNDVTCILPWRNVHAPPSDCSKSDFKQTQSVVNISLTGSQSIADWEDRNIKRGILAAAFISKVNVSRAGVQKSNYVVKA